MSRFRPEDAASSIGIRFSTENLYLRYWKPVLNVPMSTEIPVVSGKFIYLKRKTESDWIGKSLFSVRNRLKECRNSKRIAAWWLLGRCLVRELKRTSRQGKAIAAICRNLGISVLFWHSFLWIIIFFSRKSFRLEVVMGANGAKGGKGGKRGQKGDAVP